VKVYNEYVQMSILQKQLNFKKSHITLKKKTRSSPSQNWVLMLLSQRHVQENMVLDSDLKTKTIKWWSWIMTWIWCWTQMTIKIWSWTQTQGWVLDCVFMVLVFSRSCWPSSGLDSNELVSTTTLAKGLDSDNRTYTKKIWS